MKFRRFRPIVLACAAVLGLVLPQAPAAAYQVAPMIYDLKPSGSGAATIIRVRNDGDKPLTIELEAEKRAFDENGAETRTPADDDFVLFPVQAVVQPGKTQAVRVQYVGKPDLAQSETYLVTVRQVPVALPDQKQSGVQMVFNFSTMATIVPEGAKPAVTVVSTTREGADTVLRLRNDGNRYANIGSAKVSIGGQTVSDEEWRKALRSVWLLPGNDRVVRIPGAPATGDITFELGEQAS
ncbi:molecular chaperone [Novosphingobium sp. ERN07]|uniref:fimbrial biogenesis chaperone n=1 Tax=Novosphingobium sp. ERN07 TaxID=2726187 RepID=UPI0014568D74|nr:fimbria/pilus periplasmic chaperone [Novosphingobium sp. ERN07]NLR72712.1 molecular chaperone [Novosphingobium sp. ERN07]